MQEVGADSECNLLSLPDELLLQILQHVRDSEVPAGPVLNLSRDLFALQRTSRRFHTLLAGPSKLWSNLDISAMRDRTPEQSQSALSCLVHWLAPRAQAVETLQLVDLRPEDAAVEPMLELLGPFVSKLEWQRYELSESGAPGFITIASAQNMLTKMELCPNLVAASLPALVKTEGVSNPVDLTSLHGLSKLAMLQLPCVRFDPASLADCVPRLRELDMDWCLDWGPLAPLSALTALSNLGLIGLGSAREPSEDAPFAFISALTGLKRLSIQGFESLSQVGFRGLRNLAVLNVADLPSLTAMHCLSDLAALRFLRADVTFPAAWSLVTAVSGHLEGLQLYSSLESQQHIDLAALASLKKLTIHNMSMPGLPASLSKLCQLTELVFCSVKVPCMHLSSLTVLTQLQFLMLVHMEEQKLAGSFESLAQQMPKLQRVDTHGSTFVV